MGQEIDLQIPKSQDHIKRDPFRTTYLRLPRNQNGDGGSDQIHHDVNRLLRDAIS